MPPPARRKLTLSARRTGSEGGFVAQKYSHHNYTGFASVLLLMKEPIRVQGADDNIPPSRPRLIAKKGGKGEDICKTRGLRARVLLEENDA